MKSRFSALCVGTLLVLALATACTQQAPAPTAKPAAAAPTTAPAAKPTTAPAPAATTAPAAPATAAPAAQKPARVGKIVMANGSDIGSNDPYLQPAGSDQHYRSAVFEPLMQYDFDGKLVGSLATGFKWVNDKTLEYTLRKGVKFHNGDPFTAADVKFSVERGFTPWASKAEKTGQTKHIDKIEIVDDYTIRFVLKQVLPVFPYATAEVGSGATIWIVPKNYIEKNGNEYFNNNPVGTGPFKFKSRAMGTSLTVEAFDGWWGPDPWDAAPNVKEVELRYLPEASTRLAALLSGEADVMDGVPFSALDTIAGKAGYKSKVVVTTMSLGVDVNTAIAKIPGTEKANPFLDKRVRQAMRYAIDNESIIKNITKGFAKPTEGPWAPPGLGAQPQRLTTKYTYNPDKAKQLLKEANFPTDVEFNHYVYDNASRPGWADGQKAAAQYFRAVGMNVNTRMVDVGYVLDHRRQQDIFAMVSWPIMYPYQSPIRTSGLTTKEGLAPNYTIQGDKKIDELVVAAESTTDAKEREERWFKAYEYMNENASWVPLFIQPVIYGTSPRVDYKLIPADEPNYPHRIVWQAGYPK